MNGERHKADYISDGRLFITFRSIERGNRAKLNAKNITDKKRGWISEGLVAWVGTYDDLKNGTEGEYRIKIAHIYCAYHGPNQAHGLSFSVPDGIPAPPSLKNIYKEIESDLGIEINKNGNLENWAKQGVFLLNAVLTVRASEPTSHSRIGWTEFTDAVIKAISDNTSGVVFMLWGNFARSKKELIDSTKHYVLEAAHPSPLARGAFFGCKHFSKCNEILKNLGKTPINWSL